MWILHQRLKRQGFILLLSQLISLRILGNARWIVLITMNELTESNRWSLPDNSADFANLTQTIKYLGLSTEHIKDIVIMDIINRSRVTLQKALKLCDVAPHPNLHIQYVVTQLQQGRTPANGYHLCRCNNTNCTYLKYHSCRNWHFLNASSCVTKGG